MLTYQLLRNHAGLLLCGDYETLQALHEVVHDINERSPLIRNKEGLFLGLAYDVRKAYEGARQKLAPPKGLPEIGPRFGVEILWPVLLLQSRILRASMAYIETSKRMQAHAYALESVIETGLREDFGGDLAASIAEHWERIDPTHQFPEEALDSRGAIFCSWTKAQRKKRIRAAEAWERDKGTPAHPGFACVRVHDLKHTFGRRLKAANVATEDRKNLLGHKIKDVTELYSSAEIASLIKEANKVSTTDSRSPVLTILKMNHLNGSRAKIA